MGRAPLSKKRPHPSLPLPRLDRCWSMRVHYEGKGGVVAVVENGTPHSPPRRSPHGSAERGRKGFSPRTNESLHSRARKKLEKKKKKKKCVFRCVCSSVTIRPSGGGRQTHRLPALLQRVELLGALDHLDHLARVGGFVLVLLGVLKRKRG